MKRKFWKTLEEWDSSTQKKPLIVIGARQIGKTYIIEEYCKKKYPNYCYINLFRDDRLIEIYDKFTNFDQRLEFLQQRYNINLRDKDTILFVDEVQECEAFIESLKLFNEDGINNIVCAGSLLGVKLKRLKKSFPVGKVHQEIMYPMDFEEFLIATGNERYIDNIKESFINNRECLFHKELLDLFNRYLYLGGMPEVIQNYIDNSQNLSMIDNTIINDIILGYMEDISKHNKEKQEVNRINAIYNNIPPQLLKENPKFMYSKFDKKERKGDYINALDWLTASRLVLKCNVINKPEYPIKLFSDDENYKLFLSDIGILRSLMDITVSDMFFQDNYQYKGIIAENYVATELQNMFGNIYYWSKKGNENNSKAEVDFVIQIKQNVIPIEVKAGDNIKSKSLDIYNKEYNPKLMIRISTKNFGIKGNLKSIPLYATFLIKDLLNNEL